MLFINVKRTKVIFMSEERISRRDAVKRAAYITPVIISMVANLSFASSGSGREGPHRDENKLLKKEKNSQSDAYPFVWRR
jgi:hypothetical protein